MRPSGDAEGCLQDHHWAVGSFGYFPSYALGGFISAQLYETLRNDHPDLDREIEVGRFGSLSFNLTGTLLEGAKLSKADLRWVNARQANLRGADLREANLEGADLTDAPLDGVLFQGATMPDGKRAP